MPVTTSRAGVIIVYESLKTGERKTLALHFPFQSAVDSFLRLAKSHGRVRPLYLVRVRPHPRESK